MILSVLLLSCHKEISHNGTAVDLSKLETFIKGSNPSLLNKIDWSLVLAAQAPDIYYRIALKNSDFSKDFIVFKEDSRGNIVGAKIVGLAFDHTTLSGTLSTIDISEHMKEKEEFIIINGHLADRYTKDENQIPNAFAAVDDYGHLTTPMLAKIIPDPRFGPVVVVMQYSALYYISIRQSYEAIAQPGTSYQLVAGESKNDYGGSSHAGTSVINSGYPVNINVDDDRNFESNPVVDVQKMIDCFNSIPDQGATCSIEIMTDIPVNDNPGYLTDHNRTYAGHCFLQIKKSNQGKFITQNIGLYPKTSIKSIATTAPIPGRFVDDKMHSYNASMKIDINFVQLAVVLNAIRKYGATGPKYDIDSYNCTDFALNIFNLVRAGDPLVPDKYQLPGAPATVSGSNLPQGVYKALFMRKKKSPVDRPKIKLSGTNLYSDVTTSTCH